MEVLVAHLSDSRRNAKYSYAAIVEMCLKLYPENPYMKRLVSEAKQRLS
jgi:ubiquinone biosynthesis protein COQ9